MAVLILYSVRVKNLCDIIMKTLVTISVEKITPVTKRKPEIFSGFLLATTQVANVTTMISTLSLHRAVQIFYLYIHHFIGLYFIISNLPRN